MRASIPARAGSIAYAENQGYASYLVRIKRGYQYDGGDFATR